MNRERDPAGEGPQFLFRFEPSLESGPGAGSWLRELLGRASLEPADAVSSLELETRPGSRLQVMEGPAAGRSFFELASELGPGFAGLRGEQLAALGMGLSLRLSAYETGDSPVFMIRPGPAPSKRSAPTPGAALVILEAGPGAKVYYGRRKSLSEDRFRSLLLKGPGLEILEERPALAGQTLLVPPGLPYALGRGLFVYEAAVEVAGREARSRGLKISDLGPRARHAVTAPAPRSRLFVKGRGLVQGMNAMAWLYAMSHVCSVRLDLREEFEENRPEGESFIALTGLRGRALLMAGGEISTIAPGDTRLVAANCPRYRIAPESEGAAVIKTWLPDPVDEIEKPLRNYGLSQREIQELYGFFGQPPL